MLMAMPNEQGQAITFIPIKVVREDPMALANLACLLARDEGREGVLMVDWDLEAPWTSSLFLQPQDEERSQVSRFGADHQR